MSIESIKAQLIAIKSMADAILAEIDQEEECDHPKDERIDMSTMGHERWQCGVCGFIYDPDGGE